MTDVKTTYVPDETWDCPFLQRQIPEGLYTDIYEAMYGGLKKSAVPEVKDWNLARKSVQGIRIILKNLKVVA